MAVAAAAAADVDDDDEVSSGRPGRSRGAAWGLGRDPGGDK